MRHYRHPLAAFVIAAISYYVAGRFGLLLAIPPGFSSAVWPAAGLALACVILLPKIPALLGIGVGSFFVNVSVAKASLAQFAWADISAPLMIGCGAALQSLAGYFLYRYFIRAESFVDSPPDYLRFSAIVAPISCLLAPVIGAGTLYGHGYISAENVQFTAFTWWIGDVVGVLFFTPFALLLFPLNRGITTSRKLQVLVPTVFLFAFVIVLFAYSTKNRHRLNELEIQESSERYGCLVRIRLRSAELTLRSFSAFFLGAGTVTHDNFVRFAENQIKGIDVFQGVGWTEVVTQRQRREVEASIRQEGFPGFEFKEPGPDGTFVRAAERSEHYPVLYIYPYETNKKALGLDLAFNRDRLKALTSARDLKKPTATAPIKIVQGSQKQNALIMYWPVFDDRLSQSSDNFRGYVSGVLRINGILGQVFSDAKKNHYGISLIDVTGEEPSPLLVSEEERLERFNVPRRVFQFGQRELEISIYPTKQFKLASKDWTSWSVLTFGLLIAALMKAFILNITGSTERTRREVEEKTKDLKVAMQQAERANLAKTQFLANINHEIRTPLNAIKGMISRCFNTSLNDQQYEYLSKAQLALSTLLSLINQTLDYSKIEAGKMELEKNEFDLCVLLQKIYAMFSIQAEDKNIEFRIDIPDSLPGSFIADALRLEQILLNLCSNAIKFTETGYVELKLLVERNEDEALLIFEIKDSGIGISHTQQQQLFSTFQQADSSMTRKYGGTGLGLAISKHLANIMGGQIGLESQLGEGSTFTLRLTLPIGEDKSEQLNVNQRILHPESIALAAPSAAPSEGIVTTDNRHSSSQTKTDSVLASEAKLAGNSLQGCQILLVEDVLMNQEIACMILEDFDAKVSVANNGVEALNMLKDRCKWDVILMDIQMPEMDGYEATRRIKEDDNLKEIPVIAMTANAAVSDIEACNSAGMEGYVSKPIDEKALVEEICKFWQPKVKP